jgi:tRNA (guanine26-N2/guanine27-N2)-dimethyltransferase
MPLKFKALEALSASGLRSIRYALEMDDLLEQIVANDMSKDAVEAIRRNIQFNGLTEERVKPNQADAK